MKCNILLIIYMIAILFMITIISFGIGVSYLIIGSLFFNLVLHLHVTVPFGICFILGILTTILLMSISE